MRVNAKKLYGPKLLTHDCTPPPIDGAASSRPPVHRSGYKASSLNVGGMHRPSWRKVASICTNKNPVVQLLSYSESPMRDMWGSQTTHESLGGLNSNNEARSATPARLWLTITKLGRIQLRDKYFEFASTRIGNKSKSNDLAVESLFPLISLGIYTAYLSHPKKRRLRTQRHHGDL